MEPLDRETASKLFDHYRKQRDGIRNCPEMGTICLICGSIHIKEMDDKAGKLICRNCGFSWYRYECPTCRATVDGRDSSNPGCHVCGLRICSCGACGCVLNEKRVLTGATL